MSLFYLSILYPGGDPSADIRPTFGSLQFITNARRQTISLTVLPDDLPEVDEVLCMTYFNRIIYAIRIIATQTSEYVAVLYELHLVKVIILSL